MLAEIANQKPAYILAAPSWIGVEVSAIVDDTDQTWYDEGRIGRVWRQRDVIHRSSGRGQYGNSNGFATPSRGGLDILLAFAYGFIASSFGC